MDKFALRSQLKRIAAAALLVILLISVGTVGFMQIEGWSFLDSLYMVLISVTTVGYGETHTLSTMGRVFTMFLIVSGVGMLGATLTLVTQFLIVAQFSDIMGGRTMQKEIDKLRDHYIIAGFGRMGRTIAEEFHIANKEFVIIELNESRVKDANDLGYLVFNGSSEKDDDLAKAGIEFASGLIAVAPRDDVNLVTTLSARSLNPSLNIATRANEEGVENKLRLAGADTVWSPYLSTGLQLARSILQPNMVAAHIAGRSESDKEELQLVEIRVELDAEIVGKSLKELNLIERYKVIVVSISRMGGMGGTIFCPSADTKVSVADVIKVVGDEDGLIHFANDAAQILEPDSTGPVGVFASSD